MTEELREDFINELTMLFAKKPGELDMSARLRDDLNAKSLHYMGIVGTVEELTGKTIDYVQVHNCATIGDVVKMFETLQ